MLITSKKTVGTFGFLVVLNEMLKHVKLLSLGQNAIKRRALLTRQRGRACPKL
nr:MAG TPA_asm: hypothetical protein [Caudoviricetes sp.]